MSTAPDDLPARPRPSGPTAGAVLALPFAVAMVTATRGAVLAKVWAWFVVPLGAPHIGWLHGAGLATLVLVALPNRRSSSDPDEPRDTGRSVLVGALGTSALVLVALGVAAVLAALR